MELILQYFDFNFAISSFLLDNERNNEHSTLQQVMDRYVTEKRFVSAITKTGKPGHFKIDNEIKREFFDDVMTDLEQCDNDLFKRWTESSDKDKNEDVMRRKISGLLTKYKYQNMCWTRARRFK